MIPPFLELVPQRIPGLEGMSVRSAEVVRWAGPGGYRLELELVAADETVTLKIPAAAVELETAR